MKKIAFFLLLLAMRLQSDGQHLRTDSIESTITSSSAISKVREPNFNEGINHSPYQLMNGRLTGIGISTSGNDPNGEFLLRVRGLSTFQRSTSPLLVIDGFVVEDLSLVDPNDISEFLLLKDAAATSSFGLQGANGVLLISTKKATDERSMVSFKSSFGIDQPIKKLDALSSAGYRQYANSVDLGGSEDWLDAITRMGRSAVNSLAFSKNGESFSVRASVNSRIAQGTLQGTGFEQTNFRIGFQQRALKDRLLLQGRIAATSRESDYGFREAIKYAYSSNPTMPVLNANLSQYGGYSQAEVFDNYNPVAIIEQNANSGKETTSSVGINGDYSFDGILKELKLGFTYQILSSKLFNGRYFSKNSFYVGKNRNGLASRSTDSRKQHQFTSSLSYEKTFGDLEVDISSGYQYREHKTSSSYMEGGDFLTDAFTYNNMETALDFQNGLGINSSSQDLYKVISWVNSGSVVYKKKYFLNAAVNYSGSTRLGKNNKWGLFPALTGGLQWSEGISIFDYLKLRASWGKAGNLPQASNLSGSLMTAGSLFYYNGAYVPQYNTSRDANSNLKWEEKSEFNIGADFTLLNGRISGGIDWFTSNVKDLIAQVSIPSPPALSGTTFGNLGKLQNRGLEFNLDVSARKTLKFRWDMTFNLSHVVTRVKGLSGNGYSLGDNGKISTGVLSDAGGGCSSHGVILIEEGAKLGQIQGPIFTGIADGMPRHRDLNGDNSYCDCPDDFAVLGNALPKFNFGFGHRFSYNNFEVHLLFRGASGHRKINAYRIYQEGTGVVSSYNLVETSHFNSELLHTHLSNLYVEKAGFIRLDNLSILYHVPTPLKFAVSVTIQNLFTITRYSGTDPEVAYGNPKLKGQTYHPGNESPLVSGLELRGNYLPSRIFSVGVTLNL